MKRLIPQNLKNIYHLATALFARAYFRFPDKGMRIIGVTGTDGKTTTSTMIHHILTTNQIRTALISTVAAYIDEDELDTGFHVTSPSAWQLQKILRQIKDRGIDTVVLEVTSHGLDQHRVFGVSFLAAVYTNITHEHLDYHRTMARYVKAKSKLARRAKHIILNDTDTYSKKILDHISHKPNMIRYNSDSCQSATNKLTNIPQGYNQLNACAAIHAANLCNIQTKQCIKAMHSFPGISGRMESMPNTRDINIIVDFAHTPHALESALTSLKKTTKGRLIAVFGAAGRRDSKKRPQMGKIASKLADEVILTSEDPRDENPKVIIRHIKEGIIENHGHIHAIIDRQDAINVAINTIAKAGDTVAIFGKGHEKSLNLDGNTEIPWSDQKAVHNALNIK